MGNECQDPKNLVAVTRAGNQIQGDIFTEAERVKNFSGEQRFHYEKAMAHHFGIKIKGPKETSALDVLKKRTKINSDPKGPLDDRMYARPTEQMGSKFKSSMQQRWKAYQKAGATPEAYKKYFQKPSAKMVAAIDQVVTNSKSRADLNRNLKPLGLNADNLYDGRAYFGWLEKGGWTQKGWLEPVKKTVNSISKAQANWNFTWTLGNGVDMIRVYSHYATKPGGLKAILEGTARNVKAGALVKQPRFEKMGLYDSVYKDRSQKALDPFSRSIIAQKNLVGHIEESLGGKASDGVANQLFDAPQWDQPRAFRGPDANLIFGLARYPINETRYLLKTGRRGAQAGIDLLQGKKPKAEDQQAAANFVLYHIAKGAIVGTRSLVPAMIYLGIPKEMKDAVAEWEDKHNLNLIRIGSTAAFQKMGINAGIDLTEYTQPGGGTLGARAKSLVDTGTRVGKDGTKAIVELANGKIGAGTAHALAATSALANLGGFTTAAKGLAGQVLDQVNSTTVTKLLETLGESMRKELDQDKTQTNLVKAVFGERNVKAAKQQDDLPDLPALPSI